MDAPFTEIFNEFKINFNQTFLKIAQRAEMIELNTEIIQNQLDPILAKAPRDNLILNTIIAHAQNNSQITKVLLSANSREFDQPEAREILTQVGIEKYFTTAKYFLGWVQSKT